jgi:hypothetical protein
MGRPHLAEEMPGRFGRADEQGQSLFNRAVKVLCVISEFLSRSW